MPKLAKNEIENLTAADMRDFMYGEIQSMIEGNAPENATFHYFMPPIPFGPELAAFMDIGPNAQEWKDKGFTNNDLMRSAVNFASIVDYVPEISKDEKGEIIDINTLIASGQKISNAYESILSNCRVVNNARSDEDKEKLKKLRALLYKEPAEEEKPEPVEDSGDDLDDLLGDSSSSEDLSDEDLLSGLGGEDASLDDIFADGASTEDIVADPNSISEPTTAMKLYDALALKYDTVVLNALDELKKISPNDPNAGLRKKILKRKIRAAKQRWEAQGKKTLVESIIARIEQLSQGGMPEYLAELRERFEGNQILASLFADEELGSSLISESAYYTALRPNGILNAKGMMRVRIHSSSMQSERKFKHSKTSASVKVPFSFGAAGASGSAENTKRNSEFFSDEFEISFEIVQGLIDRPWFAKDFIESRAYTTVDPRTDQPLDPVAQITKLSDGKIPPEEGLLKAIPMTVYFIKDLTVRSKALARMSESEINKMSGKAGVSIFGFGANAKHENTTVNTSYSRAGTMGEIRADGIYLVGMSSIYLKNSPNPDFDSFPEDQWI
ncbi:hypothetical protein [Kangiella shandongensis]|uniref:hypothetical protein n=1 Tax=Kangiella shandongensis TaxID=2763258 RepID=UPI001CBBBA19|nr:hypothetical protein [Kangiella shandongensis]